MRDFRISSMSVPLFVIACIFLAYFSALTRSFASSQSYSHPDEVIAEKVVNHMVRSGDVNSNWVGLGLPESFDYPQFNFSGYHIFASLLFRLLNVFTGNQEVSLLDLRTLSGVLWFLSLAAIVFISSRLFGALPGLLGGVLFLVNPLLFQDSLYARPESYVVFMSILFFGVLALNRRESNVSLLVAAMILGSLVGTKISFIPFALAILAWCLPIQTNVLSSFQSKIRFVISRLSIASAGMILGLFLSVPYGFANPDAYMFGFQTLSTQYTTGHWPHGLPDATVLDRFWYALTFFVPTAGVLFIVLFLLGLILAFKTRRYMFALMGMLIVLITMQFSSYPTFFERNFSHLVALSIFFVIFGVCWARTTLAAYFTIQLIPKMLTATLIVLLTFPPARTTFYLVTEALTGKNQTKVDQIRRDIEAKVGYKLEMKNSITDQVAILGMKDLSCLPRFIDVTDYGDDWTRENIRQMQEKLHYIVKARIPSMWEGTSPSTLQTYFSAGHVLLLKSSDFPDSCPEVSNEQ